MAEKFKAGCFRPAGSPEGKKPAERTTEKENAKKEVFWGKIFWIKLIGMPSDILIMQVWIDPYIKPDLFLKKRSTNGNK